MLIKLSRYVINTNYLIYSEDDPEMDTTVILLRTPYGTRPVIHITITGEDREEYDKCVSPMSA